MPQRPSTHSPDFRDLLAGPIGQTLTAANHYLAARRQIEAQTKGMHLLRGIIEICGNNIQEAVRDATEARSTDLAPHRQAARGDKRWFGMHNLDEADYGWRLSGPTIIEDKAQVTSAAQALIGGTKGPLSFDLGQFENSPFARDGMYISKGISLGAGGKKLIGLGTQSPNLACDEHRNAAYYLAHETGWKFMQRLLPDDQTLELGMALRVPRDFNLQEDHQIFTASVLCLDHLGVNKNLFYGIQFVPSTGSIEVIKRFS